MIILLPLLIALIGLVVWLIATNAKVAEVGRIMFFCGLLVFLWTGGPAVVTVLKR